MTKRKVAEATATEEQPKKKTRRMKVLSPKKISKNNQQVYDNNAKDSPLLRLPPEIRNRIFNLVLCGNNLHIHISECRSNKVSHTICRCATDDEYNANAIKARYSDDSNTDLGVVDRLHASCSSIISGSAAFKASQLNVSVLAVCRQAHQEAALLPFTGNTFSFPALFSMGLFLKALVPAQAHAIEKITVEVYWSHKNATFENLLRTKLRGLRELVCFVDTNYSVPIDSTKGWMSKMAASLLQFRHSPITKAIVVATYDGMPFRNQGELSTQTVELVIRRIKQMEDTLVSSAA